MMETATALPVRSASAFWRVAYALPLLGVVVMLVLALRMDSPHVVFDELAYYLPAIALDRIDELREIAPRIPQLNNFLYLRALNLIHEIGIDLNIGAKLFNVLCIGAANLLLVRRLLVADGSPAVLLPIAVVSLFPTITYASYVMPEAAYFFGFTLVVLRMMDGFAPSSPRAILPVVLLIAALTLVKAHGVLIFVALSGAVVLYCLMFDRRLKVYAVVLLLMIGTYAAATLLLNLVLKPPSLRESSNFLGSYYWSYLVETFGSTERLGEATWSFTRHLIFLGALLAPSIGLCAFLVAKMRNEPVSERRQQAFVPLFLLTCLVTVLLAVAYFLAQEADRIHLRYLNFSFPVLLTFVWVAGRKEMPARSLLPIALLWLAAVLAAWWLLASTRPLAIDSPELFAFYGQSEFGAFAVSWLPIALLIMLALAALLLTWQRRHALEIQMTALAVITVAALWNIAHTQTAFSQSPYQAGFRRIGDVARLLCGPAPADLFAIGSTDLFEPLTYAMYRIGRPVHFSVVSTEDFASTLQSVPSGACLLTTEALPAGRGEALFAVPELWLYRTTSN